MRKVYAPGLCPGALICEIWFARLQVAGLGSAASANRLHCYDTHTLDTPEHALGSYYYTTDDEGWPRARVCLVHVPSAVPVPVGFPTLLANTDRSRPSFCLVFQVSLVHHSFARDHTVAFLSARGQRTSKHLSHHVRVQVTCTRSVRHHT